MPLLDGGYLEVLEATEFVTIVTTWGDYVRQLGIEGDRLVIPAGYYFDTEENLHRDPRIQLLVASRSVEGRGGA